MMWSPSPRTARLGAPVCVGRDPSPEPVMTTTTLTTIHVPSMLRPSCGGAARLAVPGGTVRAALEELERRHPALHRCICDETGAVRRHVGVFVNTEHIRDLEGLETSLGPGDTITILPAVSGG